MSRSGLTGLRLGRPRALARVHASRNTKAAGHRELRRDGRVGRESVTW